MNLRHCISASFQRLVDSRPMTGASGLIIPPAVSPVARYVNVLVSRLADHGGTITLKASDQLPLEGECSGAAPAYTQVVNRLKVLSGLDPVGYPQPVSASFEQVIRGTRHRIETRFDDRSTNPQCQLLLAGIGTSGSGGVGELGGLPASRST